MSTTSSLMNMAAGTAVANKYIVSNNTSGSLGLTVGDSVTNLGVNSTTSSTTVPANFNPRTGYSLVLTNSISNGYRWADWGNDIFDNWGFTYIFNPDTNTAFYIAVHTSVTSEGFWNYVTHTIWGRTFKIRWGWMATGIARTDVTCTDPNFKFSVGHYGNLGSDAATAHIFQVDSNDFNASYTGNPYETMPLGSVRTYQSYSTNVEQFQVYCIPKLYKTYNQIKNSSTPSTARIFKHDISGNDNLAIWTEPLTHGVMFYYVKGNNFPYQRIVADLKVITSSDPTAYLAY